jgi:hypothetical protein
MHSETVKFYPNDVGSFFSMCRGSGWYGFNHSYAVWYRNSENITAISCFLCPFVTQISSETWISCVLSYCCRSGIDGIPIYNYVSSCENPITWDRYIKTSIDYSWQIPFDKSVWTVTLTNANVYFLYKIYALFFHLLPALMVDIVLFSLGQKPR